MANIYLKNHWEHFYDFRVALNKLKVSGMTLIQLNDMNEKIEIGRY